MFAMFFVCFMGNVLSSVVFHFSLADSQLSIPPSMTYNIRHVFLLYSYIRHISFVADTSAGARNYFAQIPCTSVRSIRMFILYTKCVCVCGGGGGCLCYPVYY